MADPTSTLENRFCEECSTHLNRKEGEDMSAWKRRRFCSVKCARTFGPRRDISGRLAAGTCTEAGQGPNGECHEWKRAKDKNGYGHIRYEGKCELVHRLVYRQAFGISDESLFVCHHCDNPSCVRIDHLYLGTHQDNMDDRSARDRARAAKGEDSHLAKLTETDVVMIRNDRRLHRLIADDYKVTRALVSHIKRRIIWAHVP